MNIGRFLTSKEVKPILALLKEQWGFDHELYYALFFTGKERIYAINRAVDALDFSKFRINSIGMYFAEFRNNELRLSIEGSQIIGPFATKNVLELTREERNEWIQGHDLDKDCNNQGFVIIKSGKDFFGSGRCKEGKILNFVPKARRLLTADLASE